MTPLIHSLLSTPIDGAEIEARSLATIDAEAPAHRFTPDEWAVVRRMIHTTADFSLIADVRFSPHAIERAIAALRRAAPIFADSNMIRAGLSQVRLRAAANAQTDIDIACHVADADIAQQAKAHGLPRSLYAARKARTTLDGGIALFGNAPVALLELNRMIVEENVHPAFVVAMPVGFVHVVESKTELMSLDVPYVAIAGRRGGSTLAVAALHALCELARGSAQ